MNSFLKLSYASGNHAAFEKLGLRSLPELGYGERQMLEDPEFPESMRQTELDSYLQRAISTPISPEQEFMEQRRLEGTLGGGAIGGTLGLGTGYGLAKALQRPAGLPMLIGALGAGTLGALTGRPLGAEAGRREHAEQAQRQEEMGELFTDPYRMHRELQRHLAQGRRKRTAEDRDHDRTVASLSAPPDFRVNYNIDAR